MHLKKLINYLKTDTKSLMNMLHGELKGHGYIITKANNFLYATPTTDHVPVLLVAHVDTFHAAPPKDIFIDRLKTVMWSPEGIGGDDRCGVYVVMELIKLFKCAVLFTDLEERGAVGARDFIRDFPKNPNYKMAIQFDRKNGSDCVFYDNDSDEFQTYIEKYDFVSAIGSFSDISVIAPKWEVNAVNLSVGYYNEHTKHEYIDYSLTQRTIDRTVKLLNDPIPTYEYKELVSWNHYVDNTSHWSRESSYTSSYQAYKPGVTTVMYGLDTCDYCGEQSTSNYSVKDFTLCKKCYHNYTIPCDYCGEDTLDFDITEVIQNCKMYDVCSKCVDSVKADDTYQPSIPTTKNYVIAK